ncbi:amyloid-beta A4 precursor protein-binding family A member 1-like [Mastacembelus armatus]|uniref:amyloid-beta A4 precursor protein-binding family A member 1-like n=1 Tax=Mastacembelus armatus TaxID=205130 RepID=UPI000E45C325|nr:amyloid-beta A4 precursor protein-binding family A member 1-like [Mastacembelus armatus]
MSNKYQGEAMEDAGEEKKVPLRSKQPNGATPGEPPVRRSWRPCQMLNQDGEFNPHHHHHHHHHPPPVRGPPRHRRRPPSEQGQGQSQAQSPGLVPVATSSRLDGDESRDTETRSVQHTRHAVTRYRRHGDPNPRLRGHRQRQPIRETHNSSPGANEREGPVDLQVQQHLSYDAATDQSQQSFHQTPITVVTPTHLSPGPSTHNMQLHPQQIPSAEAEEDLQDHKVECGDDLEKIKEKGKEQEQAVDDGDQCTTSHPSSSCDEGQTAKVVAEECAQKVEDNQEQGIDDVAEDIAARRSEITDLCSDTESAASLSLDGPLHSPPPLHSPTPPSSPDVPPFPQLDHFSEDTSMSPVPDNDLLEDEDEDSSQSCSLSHSTSCSESYPKTYADFYTESHQKSYREPVYESYSKPKPHPNSFPEPLKTDYPELPREPHKQPCWRTQPNEAQKESCQEPFTSHRQENVQRGATPSPTKGCYHAPKQGREQVSRQSPLDRSVGCRLHHYDGQSDGEGDSADQSPVPRSCRQPRRQTETQGKSLPSGQSSSGETQDERNTVGLLGTETLRCSGDAISLVIKNIKEAIEEVKTKTVRSPYTPDQPVEPIWVMRQDVSPTEDVYPLQTTAGPSSPHSPCQPLSPREPLSPFRAESSRALQPQHNRQQQPQHNHQRHPGHHSQQTDTSKPSQTYAQTQSYAHVPPNQHQQYQKLSRQQPSPPVQPQSPPQQPSVQEIRRSLPPFPTFVDVPGPCDPEDLIDGIIFAATYLGCTHLLSERTPSKSARMQQAQEAMTRVRAAQKQAKNKKKSPDGEAPSTAEVDLFMSTQRIKVLNADTQESLMDLPLRTISYIADIGNMVVLMARGKMVRSRSAQENLDNTAEQTTMGHDDRRLYKMICHVFESEDAQLIAQSIGQSFSVAYQEFLRANGINPEDLSQREYSDLLNTQDMYNDDLIHFSKSENCRDVYIEKQKGEILGVVIVESGWGSILPTVIIASLMHAGPAEKSGRLNIGDQIMTINGTSLVGLPLSTCQSIIKGLKSQSRIKMNIVRCPPVTMVLIRRPDLRYQLGFSVQNGIICSLMRGGIAERGGVRVGHRIIEINSQSVVATPHEKIVQILSNAMGEIHMKTMPAAMYRLLTAQEQPVYI